ncbi:MAG: 50S ribosomal protein L6 [Lentisphaerae bacterium GWF2_52_8]|nr:MAG: 50S ribosomal protein L6 [Lentisphaerae bacterium GWF2_52_8]
MSRIGKKPVPVPSGVKVAVKDGCVLVEGAKSKLSTRIPPMVSVDVKDGNVLVTRSAESNQARAMHGLARSLINNMMLGVTQGYKKELQIVGVGYKAVLSGSKLTLSLGFSHPVVYEVPQGIKMTIADSTKIMIEGADKQLVGEVAATIRRFRKPEPYKGKGVRYADEQVTIKEGKSVG